MHHSIVFPSNTMGSSVINADELQTTSGVIYNNAGAAHFL